MSNQPIYDAFISYRHTPLDKAIAKKLLKMMECYKPPKSLRRNLNKTTRVFRDQEELPTSSNLASNIYEALKNSRYLIVICSPNTPSSEWVNKEIETFISLHGRDKVLALLIDGEPSESFPLPLRQEIINGVSHHIEPLAADIRTSSSYSRHQLLKKEMLRLMAPILGCNFDDLKQRHKERLAKRSTLIACIALLFLSSFGSFSALQAHRLQEQSELTQSAHIKLQEQMNLTLRTQSMYLSNMSLSALEKGDRVLSTYLALSGLPTDTTSPDKPYSPESEYALHKALYSYKADDTMVNDLVLSHKNKVHSMELSSNGKYVLTQQDHGEMLLWETENGTPIWSYTPQNSSIHYQKACFIKEDYFLIIDEEMSLYRTSDQSIIWQKPVIPYCSIEVSDDESKILLWDDTLHIFDSMTGTLLQELLLPFDDPYNLIMSSDNNAIACNTLDGELAFMTLSAEPSIVTKNFPGQLFSNLSFSADSTKILCAINQNKENNVFDQTGTCYVFDLEGNELFNSTIERWGYDIAKFNPVDSNEIALVSDACLSLIDLSTKEVKNTYISGGNIRDLVWKGDGDMIVTASEDGTVRFYLTHLSTEIDWKRITDSTAIYKVDYASSRICTLDNDATDVKIYRSVVDEDADLLGISPLLSKFNTYNYQAYLSDSGKYAAAYSPLSETLELWNIPNKQQLPRIYYGTSPIIWSQFFNETFYYLTENQTLTALNIDTGQTRSLLLNMDLSDCKFKECNGTLLITDYNNYMAVNLELLEIVLEGHETSFINDAIITDDTLYLSLSDGTFMQKDTQKILISPVSDSISSSPSGSKIICYDDYTLNVIENQKTIFSLETPSNPILYCFIDLDESTLIIQRSDYTIELWDLTSKSQIGDAYNIDARIASHQFMASDQSILLISTYNSAIKLDSITYKPILEIPNFLAANKSGTVVLVPNSQHGHKGELLLYPYYTTKLAIKKGNFFLDNKFIDPIKKKSYCLE